MRIFAVSILAVALCVAVWAQFDSGQIAGFVRDPSQSVIVGATVTAINEGNGAKQHATTNASGYYVFPNLFVGTYTIEVEAAGFKKFIRSGVKLSAADKLSLDTEMAVGSVAESVDVTASAPLVTSETATVGRTVEARQIENLTTNGRNPIFLALLKPGVRGGALSSFVPDDVTNGGFSINGSRSDEYLVTIDGAIATRTRSSGSMLGAQDIDTVQEVQILTANYNAEYGRTGAGQIRFVTKSGTRNFHGDLVENFRNSALDANTWTRNHSPNPRVSGTPQPFRFNQYGYDISGPVFIPGKWNTDRSKLFFLWAQEWIKRRGENTATATVPTLVMRNGDLSELLNPANPFFRRARVATDPDTGQPFPNNVIPASRISHNGQALLRAYPEPTPGFQQGTNNWIQTFRSFSDLRKDTFKVDYFLTDKHRISVRGSYTPWNFNSPTAGLGRFQEDWSRPNRVGAASLISTISPTLINEFTFSANSDGKGIIDASLPCGAPCRRSTFGINYPHLFPGTKLFAEKIPRIQIDGLSILDTGPYPGFWAGFVYGWADNVTKIKGNHTMKAGIFIERSGQNDIIQLTTAAPPATNNQAGAFRFFDRGNPQTTGLALANSLLGNFDDYSEVGAKPITPWVASGWEWFVQDSWKATKKLTLEYGVRWSFWPPWHSRWNSIAMFDPDFWDPKKAAVVDTRAGFLVSGDPYDGIVLPGNAGQVPSAEGNRFPFLHTSEFARLYHGLPAELSQTHANVLQPRLGLALALTSKTVLRTGVGGFAQRLMINRDIALGGNPPFQQQQTVINGKVDAPGGATRRDFPFTVTSQDPVFKIPSPWMWNVTVQRELPWRTGLEVAYVSRRGIHNQRQRNINQLLEPGTVQRNPGINPNALRPFLGTGIIRLSENSGLSRYNGLQISAERRSPTGLQYGLAYTYSKTTDNGSSLTETLPNAYSDKGYYGISDLDRTHVLIFHYIYELPFLKGASNLTRRLLGNWELSGINQFQSGAPFSVRESQDNAGVGPGSGAQFWNLVGDPNAVQRTPFTSSAVWFNKGAFARPAAGTLGVQPRNILRNPGFWTWDVGIRKNFPVTEVQRLQMRFEFFNVLNHPNWDGANSNPTSGTFGMVTSKGESGGLPRARQLQLALKYIF